MRNIRTEARALRRPGRGAAALLIAAAGLAAASLATRAAAGAEPPPAQLRLGSHEEALGRADAPLTVVEFTDYQCPYCRRFAAETFPQLKHDYIDTGKVRFIVRDLPLTFHSAARPAAEAAHCAGEQGRFWAMHDALLGGAADLTHGGIEARAAALHLDRKRLHACLAAARYAGAIERNAADADALGVNGTPTFLIGTVAHGEVSGELVAGALPWAELDALLKAHLAGG
jgi:protein-disulfide isomerase